MDFLSLIRRRVERAAQGAGVQLATDTRQTSATSWLKIKYHCGTMMRSINIDWRPAKFDELLELIHNVFPIPPSTDIIVINKDTKWEFTQETWVRERLVTSKLYVAPLSIGAHDESVKEYPVNLRMLGGKRFDITVTTIDTVAGMLRRVVDAEGVPFDQMIAVYRGERLALGESIACRNIGPNDTFHVLLRLRGG
ncbi:Ubiquitin [Serendipita sp. 400]|nr:Ubiquitin [Serendipita sp. 400]